MGKVFEFFKKNTLLFVVFITGASVLVLEVTALRVLTPYFGNTLYSASSVIGVILAALSLGYIWGGKYADKNPFLSRFYFLIFLSGITTFISFLLSQFLLPLVGYSLSLTNGPFIMSIVLFIIPSIILGMLSPFAIKLIEKKHSKVGIGELAGKVFFASTIGSITGSLLSGFYLIPWFGVSTIMLSVATLLSLLGLIGYTLSSVKKKTSSALLIFFCFTFSISYVSTKAFVNPDIIYSKDGLYEQLRVSDQELDERPIRVLYQDTSASSGIFLDTKELAFPYTKYFELYKLYKPELDNSLVLGAGAYSVPQALIDTSSTVVVDIVDIEPELFEVAKDYFFVDDSPRFNHFVEDGRRFLYDSDKKYDLIFSDVYFSVASIPSHFVTREFFELSKEKLSEDGIFVANMTGQVVRRRPNLFLSQVETFQEIFSNSFFVAIDSPETRNVQNIIFVGVNGEKNIDDVLEEAKKYDSEIFSSLSDKIIDLSLFSTEQQILFTDDFAPVERLSSDLVAAKGKDLDSAFDGEEVLSFIGHIVSLGDRSLKADGHAKTVSLIAKELNPYVDEVIQDSWSEGEYEFTNIIARKNTDSDNRIVLGTHYDSKRYANNEKNSQVAKKPVPGANDSASGVGVLAEIARVLDARDVDLGIDLVFFDGEEGLGDYEDVEWKPIGSTHFTENIEIFYGNSKPEEAIIIDMICDKDLNLFYEKNSLENAPDLTNELWDVGNSIYPNTFITKSKYSIRDDHTPFQKIGIPSTLIIDFDYKYFHTTEDTPDKCSSESLEKVGNVVLEYLQKRVSK